MSNTKYWCYLILSLLLFSSFATPLAAQEEDAIADETEISIERPEARAFDKSKLESYRSNPKYQYYRDKPEPPKRKAKPKEYREIREARPMRFNGPRGDFSGLARGILWALMIGVGVFLLMQLFKVNFKALFKKKSDKAKVVAVAALVEEVEDIHDIEYEDLVQKAIDEGNFRKAVRLLYLRNLKLLSEKSLIQWKREKTNRQYLHELSDGSLKPLFGDVTLIFEYIWYGEVVVNKDEFNQARASFLNFEQTLRQKHAL